MGDLLHLPPRPDALPVPVRAGDGYQFGAIAGGVWMVCGGEESWWTPGDARALTALLDLIPHSRARAMATHLWQIADTAERLERDA